MKIISVLSLLLVASFNLNATGTTTAPAAAPAAVTQADVDAAKTACKPDAAAQKVLDEAVKAAGTDLTALKAAYVACGVVAKK